MKALMFKEVCLLKKQVKQCALNMVLIIVLNAYFINQNIPVSYITFNLPILACMILAVQLVHNTVLSEKKNKTYEKMFTVYTIEELIFSKVLCVGSVMSVFACIYNISVKLVAEYILKFNVNYSNTFAEIVIQLLVVWFAVSTFAIIYVVCNNQALLSLVSIGSSAIISSLSMYLVTGEIKAIHLFLATLAVVAVVFLEVKILSRVNIDRIMRD